MSHVPPPTLGTAGPAPDDDDGRLGAAIRAWYDATPPAPLEARTRVLAALDALPRDARAAAPRAQPARDAGVRWYDRRGLAWAGLGACAAAAAAVVLVRRDDRSNALQPDPTPLVTQAQTVPARRARADDVAAAHAPVVDAPANGSPRGGHPATPPTPVTFRVRIPGARQVAVVGDFNGWNPTATRMHPTRDGTWQARFVLPPGRHVYAFVVDGRRWLPDPAAPLAPEDAFGTRNSVVIVAAWAPAAEPESEGVARTAARRTL